MLELKNVYKEYHTPKGPFCALNGVSLRFPNKGLVALYGENGCGKTTLLNSISLLDTDYTGEILYNGKDIKSFTDVYRRTVVSVVLQENSFVPYLNIHDNIELFCDDESRDAISKRLSDFDIPEKEQENPLCVSGGQKQRVSLIRGLSKTSRVFLVDEPTSSLNEAMEKEVFEILQTLAKDKLVIIVSHSISLIRQYANMVVFMDKGEIKSFECLGSEDIVYQDDLIEVPTTIQNFGVLNTGKVKSMIAEKGSVRLSYCSGQRRAFDPDFTISNDSEQDKKQEWTPRLRKKVIKSSMWCSRRSLIGLMALTAVIAVLMGVLCSLTYFDRYSFAYSSIEKNIDGLINFKTISITDNFIKSFGADDYRRMKKDFSSKIILSKLFDYYSYLGFEESGIYSSYVSGFAYCAADDVSIIYGKFADSSGVMITDYLADGLILLDERYDSLDSIFSKGIELGGVNLSVQGVIDTDYEQYKGIFDSEEFTRTQSYIDYQQKNIIYKSVFFPINPDSPVLDIPVMPLQYGEQFAKVIFIDEDDISEAAAASGENVCLLSDSLYQVYSEAEILKLSNGYLTVGGYKESETGENIIYITDETYKILIQSEFDVIRDVSLELKEEEEIRYLDEHGLQHNTSISGYIYKATDIITALQRLFLIILVPLFLASVACAFAVINTFLECDKHLLGFMRMVGYPKGTILGVESTKTLFFVLIDLLLTEALLFGSIWGLNAGLSSLFGFTITLFSLNAFSIIILAVDLILAFTFSLLRCRRSFKTQIIELVK